MRRYLRPSAVNRPVWLGDYTRAMMIKRILAASAVVAATAAGTSLVQAQQAYPAPPGPVYSAAPPYPPGGYAVDERRQPGAPDFDLLEDDEAPNAQSSTALSPPGPVLSPDDPRYAHPERSRPIYTDRAVPTGPIMSPDDPRYGRPAGVTPLYGDRGAPTGPILSPDDPRYAHAEGAGRHDRTGQVQRHEDDLEHRPGAEEARIEDVRAEQLEEGLEGHPRPVPQLVQIRVGPDGRLMISAQGDHNSWRERAG